MVDSAKSQLGSRSEAQYPYLIPSDRTVIPSRHVQREERFEIRVGLCYKGDIVGFRSLELLSVGRRVWDLGDGV